MISFDDQLPTFDSQLVYYIIRHPDGSCEVLEVKCHSPFIETGYLNRSNGANSTARNSSGRGGGRDSPGGLSISDRGAADSVATWHIPQLQLHILCAGLRGAVQREVCYYAVISTWLPCPPA